MISDDQAAKLIMLQLLDHHDPNVVQAVHTLDWERLAHADLSHSSAALVDIARGVWLHRGVDYGCFGPLDAGNRAMVLATMAEHLHVDEVMFSEHRLLLLLAVAQHSL